MYFTLIIIFKRKAMQKHTVIFIFGLFYGILFTIEAKGIQINEDSDLASEELTLRDESNEKETGEKLGEPLEAGQYEKEQVQKRQSFTANQRQFQKEMLDAHNKYRAKHCARALQLEDSLSQSAQNYAQRLADTNTFQHSNIRGVGENLYMAWGSMTIDGKLLSPL